MTGALWAAFVAIGLLTYATRALPFLLRERRDAGLVPGWLDALGPCLLAAMAAAILLPELGTAVQSGRALPFVAGMAAAGAAMLWRRDAGLATLAGVAGYWIAL